MVLNALDHYVHDIRDTQTPLSASELESLIQRAKQILAGELEAEPMEIPAHIPEFYRNDLADKVPPPTEAAIQYQAEFSALGYHFKGTPVAHTRNAKGQMVILAVGSEQIYALLKGTTPQEHTQFLVEATDF